VYVRLLPELALSVPSHLLPRHLHSLYAFLDLHHRALGEIVALLLSEYAHEAEIAADRTLRERGALPDGARAHGMYSAHCA
jgi:hypothetical protein